MMKVNHWRRAERAIADFRDEQDELFIFHTQKEFIAGMIVRGLTESDAIKEWLSMDSGEPGYTRRYYLKTGYIR